MCFQVRLLLLNAMDPYLDSKDGHIFLSAARLFLKAASTMKNSSQDNDGDSNGGGSALAGDFAARVRPQLVKFLKPTSQPTAQEFQVNFRCIGVESTLQGRLLLSDRWSSSSS